MQPYIVQQMELAAQNGQPLNRPLFWEFPDDPLTWDIDDSFMFGDDFLMAPVTDMGARNKTTYLPKGARYRHYFTNVSYDGGQNVTVDAPLDEFPLFHVVRVRAEQGRV
jgi:alpha-D-xyloside xylohydrolase